MTTPVTPQALRRELLRLGFQEYDSTGPAGATWVDPQNLEGLAVVVPREQDSQRRGFAETISSAVERIAWLTDEPVDVVVQRLSGAAEQLELRVVHQVTEANTVPVLKAPELIKGFIGLIKNGARTRFNGARADHRGTAGADYAAALMNIHLLAPEPGSFRLIAVAIEGEQTDISGGSHSFAREVLETTVDSLGVLSSEPRPAADLVDADVERLVDGGVSYQLLKAIQELAIVQTQGLRLEFTTRTAAPHSGPSAIGPAAPLPPVVIEDHHVSLARDLRAKLAAYAPIGDYRLQGWAETARAAGRSLEGFPTGTVIVRSKVQGRIRDVIVELDKALFPRVQPGVSELEMYGTLERISGRWHLLNPRDVQISTPSAKPRPPRDLQFEDDD